MGSFNLTCFASQQTIGPRDKARILPIMRSATYNPVAITYGDKTFSEYGYANSVCYANALWKPAGQFIPAAYDDSLEFKLDLSDRVGLVNVLEFFLFVHRSCAKVAAGENRSHDIPFDFEAFTAEKAPRLNALLKGQREWAGDVKGDVTGLETEIQTTWDHVAHVIRETRLFGRSYQGDMRPIALAVMHEHTYQELVAAVEAGKDWDGNSNSMEAYARRALVQGRERAAEYDKPDDNMRSFIFADAVGEALNRVASEAHFTRTHLGRIARHMADKLLAGTGDDEFVQAVLPLLRDRYAYAGLESYHLRLSPYSYAGQDYDNGIGQAYAKFVHRVCKKVTADRKREMG